jgi:hypothetical protein
LQNRAEKAVAKPMINSHGIAMQATSNVLCGIGSWKLIGIMVEAIIAAPKHKSPKKTGWATRIMFLFR